MDVGPKLSDVVTHYASHRLSTNVQFNAIEKNMQSIKTYPSIIYMIPYLKQRVLQMRYCEVQVDYFGETGMTLLGIMEIRWKVDGEVSRFEYSFVSYVVKGCSIQDHVQVSAVIQLAVDTVQYRQPAAEKAIIRPDNASGLSSKELISFIFNMNNRLYIGKKLL